MEIRSAQSRQVAGGSKVHGRSPGSVSDQVGLSVVCERKVKAQILVWKLRDQDSEWLRLSRLLFAAAGKKSENPEVKPKEAKVC